MSTGLPWGDHVCGIARDVDVAVGSDGDRREECVNSL